MGLPAWAHLDVCLGMSLDVGLDRVSLLNVIIVNATVKISKLCGLHAGWGGAKILKNGRSLILVYHIVSLENNAVFVFPSPVAFR